MWAGCSLSSGPALRPRLPAVAQPGQALEGQQRPRNSWGCCLVFPIMRHFPSGLARTKAPANSQIVW